MRRARPYRGENPAPGEDVDGELDPTAGIREQPRPGTDISRRISPRCTAPSSSDDVLDCGALFEGNSCDGARSSHCSAAPRYLRVSAFPPADTLSLMPPLEPIVRSIAGSVLGKIENVVGIGVDHSTGNSSRLDTAADHV